jgi:beta-lactamase class A
LPLATRVDKDQTVETRQNPIRLISEVYQAQKLRAGGTWHSHIAVINTEGEVEAAFEDHADQVIHGYSVQKLAVATAVLDKVDRGQLSFSQTVELSPGDILPGGIYHLHTVWGDQITIANFLTAMLLVSDNTAVRLCGQVVPAREINDLLAAKGFAHTQVEPVADPNRFYLGTTTPRETHQLLLRLANGTLLSTASRDFLLSVTRWPGGYHDGIRRHMSSNERIRIATKYGADYDTRGAARHEAGIIFDPDGRPRLTYALFAEGLGQKENYGATHPAVEAHAVLGRALLALVDGP